MWRVYSQGPSEQKPFKILRENGAWAYSGTAPVFWVPPIISGTGKATNFKFCTHILSIDRNKSLLQISGKVVGCVVRTLKTFQCTHILGASRGLLCDSSAVLYFINAKMCTCDFVCRANFSFSIQLSEIQLFHDFLQRDAMHSAVMRLHVVCLSICLSVTFRYRDHIGWNTSKIISRPNNLRYLLTRIPRWAIWCNRNTPKIRVE